MSTSLSPAAQAVLDAFWKQPGDRSAIAAALRVAAGLVAQMRPHSGRAWTAEQAAACDALSKAAHHLAAVADELEA